MTANEIVEQLKRLGNPGYKATMLKHGAKEPVFGVKIEDLKKFQRQIKVDQQLALDLYKTGVSEAMYLAGLIADDARMTKANLNTWVKQANSPLHSEYTVPWVAAGSPAGQELAMKWIDSKSEFVAAAGWSTLSNLAALKADADLDLDVVKGLLKRIESTIRDQPNRVRSAMNRYIISVGTYIKPLTKLALSTANTIGTVEVDMGETACKIPSAADAIKKVQASGKVGTKKTVVKC